MINKISIKNFKSLAETSVELGPFTVLVGANGAGKSSFLQAIELISWAVRFPSLQNALDEHQIEFRDLVHLRSPQALIECELGLTVQVPAFGDQPARVESVEMFIDLAKKTVSVSQAGSSISSLFSGRPTRRIRRSSIRSR